MENTIELVTVPEGSGSGSLLDQILALVKRSDSIVVKSEGTRVLVNAIKSLCSTSSEQDAKQKAAIRTISNPDSATRLAQMLGRSKKFPVLVNEAVMALLLIAFQRDGGKL